MVGKTLPDVILIFHIHVGEMVGDKIREYLESVKTAISQTPLGGDPRVLILYFPCRSGKSEVQAIPMKAMLEGKASPDLKAEDINQLVELIKGLVGVASGHRQVPAKGDHE